MYPSSASRILKQRGGRRRLPVEGGNCCDYYCTPKQETARGTISPVCSIIHFCARSLYIEGRPYIRFYLGVIRAGGGAYKSAVFNSDQFNKLPEVKYCANAWNFACKTSFAQSEFYFPSDFPNCTIHSDGVFPVAKRTLSRLEVLGNILNRGVEKIRPARAIVLSVQLNTPVGYTEVTSFAAFSARLPRRALSTRFMNCTL